MQKYIKNINGKNPEETTLNVKLQYELGGMNYYTWKTSRRGYYLYLTGGKYLTYWPNDAYATFSRVLFWDNSFKILLRELKRDNSKIYKELKDKMEKIEDQTFLNWYNLKVNWKKYNILVDNILKYFNDSLILTN